LNVFPVRLPALRERGDDILLLAEAFGRRFAQRMGRRFEELTQEERRLLKAYAWPGNVRELQNVIERALILSSGRKLDLSRAMPRPDGGVESEAETVNSTDFQRGKILNSVEFQEFEKRNLLRALEACGWKISGARGVSALMGLPPSTVTSRMKALGIRRL
jgi:formate hydrogenlyase transcriptional activator